MGFERVIGQENVKKMLRKILASGRISQSYIFHGPEGVGKDAMAIEFAKAINCLDETTIPCDTCPNCRQFGALTHPDFRLVYPTSSKEQEKDFSQKLRKKAKDPYVPLAKSSLAKILIDNTRDLKRFVSLKIYNAHYRVILISEADRMTEQAANSILKLLEEPPEKTVLILTTSKLNQLLPTIVSRCQVIPFSPLRPADIQAELLRRGTDETRAAVVSRLAQGNFRKAMIFLQEDYQALRDLALQSLIIAASSDDLERFSFVEKLASGKNKSLIKDFFALSLLWLRDTLIFHELRFDHPDWHAVLTNFDRLDDVQKLAILLEDRDIEDAISELEKLIDLIDKNIYINLILIDFMLLFKRQLI
ncbi:MAG: DNA polymerase III subunit delta' [Calditrichaeota bacterium]|nr:DNA polymerase III subunit delta' [Calditrichota bacterium]